MRHKNPRSNPPDDGIDDLSGSILDGKQVDWSRAGTELGLTPETLRTLRGLERIVEINRQLQETQVVEDIPQTIAGTSAERWGDLTLLDRIGAGARGEVWRAWDPTLQRDVALKFLQPWGHPSESAARAALLDEARALARVRHPGVVTVYGIAEYEGRVGMWMEYLRGATLAREIERRGTLPSLEVARIGADLCSALQVVHSAGLVHRDIKPTNIVLEQDGRAVLTDFGLGMRPELVDPGTRRSSGTPIFMSPELLNGEQATPQSDLYALGLTLLWARTGRSPFQSKTLEELKVEVPRGPTAALQSIRGSSPRGLVSAIEWAIDPSAAARPRNASDLAARLQVVLEDKTGERKRRRSKIALLTLAALGTAAALALIFRWIPFGPPLRGTPSIAVLPLVNLSGDPSQEYLTDGMTEELIARFAEIGGVRVISRSSVMQFKNSKEPLPEIARKLHAKMIVEGSVWSSQDRIRIAARLVDAPTGRSMWAGTFERDLSDVFAIQSDVAKAVVHRVEARITPRERARLERAPEVDPEAHRLYLQGLATYREMSADGVRNALVILRKATELDPAYPEPWLALSYAYDFAVAVGVLSEQESSTQSLAAARRALLLDPGSGPARSAVASTQLDFDWDFKAAERGYREAIALSPGDADVRTGYVTLLVRIGRFDEAIRQAKQARDLNPVSLTAGAISMFPLYEAKRYDECVRVGRDILVVHPNNPWIQLLSGQATFLAGRRKEGIDMVERSVALERIPASIGFLGYAYGQEGKADSARSILAELKRIQQTTYVDPYYFGIVHLGLGETSRALDYIEEAGLSHSPEAKLLRVDPILDPLRSQSRFQALLKRLRMV